MLQRSSGQCNLCYTQITILEITLPHQTQAIDAFIYHTLNKETYLHKHNLCNLVSGTCWLLKQIQVQLTHPDYLLCNKQEIKYDFISNKFSVSVHYSMPVDVWENNVLCNDYMKVWIFSLLTEWYHSGKCYQLWEWDASHTFHSWYPS